MNYLFIFIGIVAIIILFFFLMVRAIWIGGRIGEDPFTDEDYKNLHDDVV